MSLARRLSLVIVLALGAALLLAGCGDTADKNEYVKKNNAIQNEAAQAASGLAVSGDAEESAKQLDTASDALAKAVKDMKALDAPSDWKDEHKRLVKSLEQQQTALDKGIAALKDGDTATATTEIAKLATYSADSQKAINDMNQSR